MQNDNYLYPDYLSIFLNKSSLGIRLYLVQILLNLNDLYKNKVPL